MAVEDAPPFGSEALAPLDGIADAVDVADAADADATAQMPPKAPISVEQLALLDGGDMMHRFEALSRAFKAEVEGLVGQEKASSKQTTEQLQARIVELEGQLEEQTHEAELIAARVRGFVGQRQAACLERVFGCSDPPEDPKIASVGELRVIVDNFVAVNEDERSPELVAALGEIDKLRALLSARDEELASTRSDLESARVLKTQEERELIEFRALREKDSEIGDLNVEMAQLRQQLEELQSTHKVMSTRNAQSEAALGEKSRKILDLIGQLEEQRELNRQLSNESNTLRLQLGKDFEYFKVVKAPVDPLAYSSTAGVLSEELQREERRFKEELVVLQYNYPGLLTGAANCRNWCQVHLGRQCALYRSFLHLFQDMRQDFPTEVEVEFVSKAKEVDTAWAQREEEMRDQDAAFQEREKGFTKRWEEKRLALVAERDAKIKQLLEQAEKSKSKAESQLLMQQAKLYGQRLDAQIERAWEEQRSERDARWAEHSKAKQESRQRFKDESLSVQQQADQAATASSRFADMVQARLSTVEDTWRRNLDKESGVNPGILRNGDMAECLQAAGLEKPRLPRDGAQHVGITDVAEATEQVVKHRVGQRSRLCRSLEEQTLQQLRSCVEKFVQKEGAQARKASGPAGADDEEQAPEYARAVTIQSLLQARQHRVVAETIRQQMQDFMLVLRVASLGAARLLPREASNTGLKARGARLDLPPLPPELRDQAAEAAEDAEGVANESGGEAATAGQEATKTEEQEDEEQRLDERILYDSLARRLLERTLTPLHTGHREELLALKRAHAREVRVALQQLCQLEAPAVDRSINADVDEFRSQVKAKLVSDCESHLCEERRQLAEQVEQDLELHVSAYQRQADDEERAALKERRKWLTERLVVMQTQGAISPGDKAAMQHFREELRACELRFEKREQELLASEGDSAAAGDGPDTASAAAPLGRLPTAVMPQATSSQPSQRPPQAGQRQVPSRGQPVELSQAQVASASAQQRVPSSSPRAQVSQAQMPPAPMAPTTLPPQNRRPSRTASPSPGPPANRAHDTALPFGRLSGPPREAAALQFPASPRSGTSTAAFPHGTYGDGRAAPDHSDNSPPCFGVEPQLRRADEAAHAAPAPAPLPPPPLPKSPRTPALAGQGGSPHFGADGAAGFGRREFVQGADPHSHEAAKWYAVNHAPPLYEWPFETPVVAATNEGSELKGPRSLSAPVVRSATTPRGMQEVLPPLKQPLGGALQMRPGSAERRSMHDVIDPIDGGGAHSAGLSLGPPMAAHGHVGGGGLKTNRGAPPLLPPVATPRSRA